MKKRMLSILMTCVILSGSWMGCGDRKLTQEPRVALSEEPAAQKAPETVQTEAQPDNGGLVLNVPSENIQGNVGVSAFSALKQDAADGFWAGNEAEGCYEIPDGFNTEEYSSFEENPFRSVAISPLSTFAADVDTASYSNLRNLIRSGYGPKDIPSGAVRTEEMLNYFRYHYKAPEGNEPFGVTATIGKCPWNDEAKLLVLGLQTKDIDFSEAPDSNLVFLIDVSGSMADENKLPLLKQAFDMLVENLGEKDRVSIVTYASSNKVVLEGVPGSDKATIKKALEGLEAGGCTNGGEGIISAYRLAEKYFIKGGNNRVILATDGDLNVGITSESALHDLIAKKKEGGVFLSVLGFGRGNYSDANMETLADYGNGNYSYIDSRSEAKKVLVEEMGATLVTVAKDVKLQIEFNPTAVSEYRLIGYENRVMTAEEFEDDSKDAGEIGAGHSVTVVYELIPCREGGVQRKLKYQDTSLSKQAQNGDEWLTLSVRYKEPDGLISKLLEYPIGRSSYTDAPSDDFYFAAAVAEFSMVLRDSEYKKGADYQQILGLLGDIDLGDEYKKEFYDLVDLARLQSEW